MEISAAMMNTKAWPFVEARKLLGRRTPSDPAVFECGYGPSGLPHIGTFAEVFRTSLVRRAFTELTGETSRLIVFSDDLDALRSVPENVPNQEMLREHLGVSLSAIPDPFDLFESFAAHNNAKLCSFLDRFGFDYEFTSSSEMYRKSLEFEGGMRVFLMHHDLIRDIILPTLGPDRRETYSPIMPIDPVTNKVLEARVIGTDLDRETITYIHPETGDEIEQSVLHGSCKLQWKADWAMRWYTLEVDYEMCGKDLTDSVRLSTEIVETLGWHPPHNMIYEMFLDEDGKKISKSKGNGLTIPEWLCCGSENSLRHYLFQSPQKARELSPRAVVKAQDEYFDSLKRFPTQTEDQQLNNSVYYIHPDRIVPDNQGLTFALLLNVARTVVPRDPASLSQFVQRYTGQDVSSNPTLNALVLNVMFYYWEHCSDEIVRRVATAEEKAAITDLVERYKALDVDASEEDIQFEVYEVGKSHYSKERLREWFAMLYEVTLGQSSGPRFGAYTKLLGLNNMIKLLKDISQ